MRSWTVCQEMIQGLPLPWLSAPTAKAQNTSWGFSLGGAVCSSHIQPWQHRQEAAASGSQGKRSFPKSTLIKANAVDV